MARDLTLTVVRVLIDVQMQAAGPLCVLQGICGRLCRAGKECEIYCPTPLLILAAPAPLPGLSATRLVVNLLTGCLDSLSDLRRNYDVRGTVSLES